MEAICHRKGHGRCSPCGLPPRRFRAWMSWRRRTARTPFLPRKARNREFCGGSVGANLNTGNCLTDELEGNCAPSSLDNLLCATIAARKSAHVAGNLQVRAATGALENYYLRVVVHDATTARRRQDRNLFNETARGGLGRCFRDASPNSHLTAAIVATRRISTWIHEF